MADESNRPERAARALPYRRVALPTAATEETTRSFFRLFPPGAINSTHVTKRGVGGPIASAVRVTPGRPCAPGTRHIASGEDTPTRLARAYISRARRDPARLVAGDRHPPAQIGGDEPGGGVLPVVQRRLRHLGDQPLPGLPGGGVQAGRGGVLRIRAHPDDVGEVQRVVVAPLLGGSEIARVAGFEPGDTVGEHRLELVGA